MLTLLRAWLHNAEQSGTVRAHPQYEQSLRRAMMLMRLAPDVVSAIAHLRLGGS